MKCKEKPLIRLLKISVMLCATVVVTMGSDGACPGTPGDMTGMTGTIGNNQVSPITLNLMKLTTAATTESGPSSGDGVMAFNALNNSVLAWLRAGETDADVKQVPAPAGMTHDTKTFWMLGKKLAVQDRNSGSIYVYDTETDNVQAIPSASVNVTSGTWAADGKYVASINATVTTQDGANRRIKATDISDINNYATTPFDDPANNPNAISVDAANHRIAVRGGDSFYIYDIQNPGAPIQTWQINALQGGTGSTSDIKLRGNFLAFFNDSDNFTLLQIITGALSQPQRNPARANRGLDIQNDVFAYFASQTAEDGSTIAIVNRALVGSTADVTALLDPQGILLNGNDDSEGTVGFGATVSISPNGRFVAVAGDSPVGVGFEERLYLSIDGAAFQPIADPGDPTGFLRASSVSVSDNLISFLIPQDVSQEISAVTIGYAELPPP